MREKRTGSRSTSQVWQISLNGDGFSQNFCRHSSATWLGSVQPAGSSHISTAQRSASVDWNPYSSPSVPFDVSTVKSLFLAPTSASR